MLVQLGTVQIKLEGQCHRSKFEVTGGKQSSAIARTADRG